MQDGINLLMLVCAAVAALAFGVLAAYSVCRVGFAALRMHALAVAGQRAIAESASNEAAATA